MPDQPTQEEPRCDGCHHELSPSEVERRELSGVPVVMCRDARLCIRRAQQAGVWNGRTAGV